MGKILNNTSNSNNNNDNNWKRLKKKENTKGKKLDHLNLFYFSY